MARSPEKKVRADGRIETGAPRKGGARVRTRWSPIGVGDVILRLLFFGTVVWRGAFFPENAAVDWIE